MIVAADPDSKGRALCHEFGRCPNFLSGIHYLLRFVNSEAELLLTEYVIHNPRKMKHEIHVTFWRYQATIIFRCRRKRGLCALIIQVHDASPKKLTDKFIKTLTYAGSLLTPVNSQYPSFRDSISYSVVIILGIHSSTEEKASHLHLPNPPSIAMQYITDYIAEDFNKENYIVSWAKDR